MRPNPLFSADLVTFTEETLNGKLHFLRIVLRAYPRTNTIANNNKKY